DRLGVLEPATIDRVQNEAWPKATSADELHDALMLVGAMTSKEIDRSAEENAEQFVSTLTCENRATRLRVCTRDPSRTFHIAAERMPMLLSIYPGAIVEPKLFLPDSLRARTWQRADAIRELVRGRMEVCGPIAAED